MHAITVKKIINYEVSYQLAFTADSSPPCVLLGAPICLSDGVSLFVSSSPGVSSPSCRLSVSPSWPDPSASGFMRGVGVGVPGLDEPKSESDWLPPSLALLPLACG